LRSVRVGGTLLLCILQVGQALGGDVTVDGHLHPVSGAISLFSSLTSRVTVGFLRHCWTKSRHETRQRPMIGATPPMSAQFCENVHR
jgi:hypothetical protein